MAFGKSHRDPYATSVGHLIEKATFAGVQTEDWGQFMHICDIINTVNDGPKDAVKALKKRISKNYNHKEIELTLSLIDMCMQNCGPSFQSLIVKKEFIKDSLVKLLNPRYTLPLDIQNRILNFIKTWSQGFPGGVDVSEVKEVYLDLLKKGVHFPPSDAEAETKQQETAQISSKPPTSGPTAPAPSSVITPRNTTITLVPEQIGKLLSELDMVKMNVKVMSAILMENIPGSENHEDIELLQKLYKTGREMQERIMELLIVVENEDVTVELIQVNEDLNNAILGYERFTRNQQRILEQNNQREDSSTSSEPSAPSCDLLDLSPSPPNHRVTLGEGNTMNAQLSDLDFSSSSPVVTNNLQSSLHSRVDLLALENTETSPFAQRTGQNLTSGHMYANFPENSNSVLLQPVSLQTTAATPPDPRPPSLPNNHPAMTKNDLQPPNYYEVMEFDPLAPAVTTEAVYEEINVHNHKGAQSQSNC
ncbi:TOM1-like protein 1 isoform X1 [Rousettus aegyptiacus]|uniref:Target of myb1 like 1 membrane trafficking protein n=1 Tax=Rousettus aegyptiacus TaxID=9407 RepID=A0A7J8GHY6_ROUAE|nr:TOM1-like protein 1 isoform X1 [Rousettus aegyptiacus]KAF6459468.1 target of myb1 like 1 membrane trafficking protein [Rousettus aegyptiacus]